MILPSAPLVIESELSSREKLLWSGQPGQGIILHGMDTLVIPFTILWFGCAVLIEYNFIKSGTPLISHLFSAVFLLIGFYFVLGRLLHDSIQRKRMYYGITNERVIIVSGKFNRQVKSVNLGTLSDITLTEKSNGRGTIALGPASYWETLHGGIAWPGMSGRYSSKLESIENVRHVYDILREAENQN